jgi:hypothetical protein
MKRNDQNRTAKKSLELRKETLRQLDQSDLEQVGGGYVYATLKYCMGTNYYLYFK